LVFFFSVWHLFSDGDFQSLDLQMMSRLLSFANDQDLDATLVPKSAFVSALRVALQERLGFAAGKIGVTEQYLLFWATLHEQNATDARMRLLETWIKSNALHASGLFPADRNLYLRFAQVYLQTARELDFIGLFRGPDAPFELKVVNDMALEGAFMRFQNLHPDSSIPDDPSNCYLPLFQGKKILIVNPFANLLASRATREIFEGVWAVSGKKFFEPESVEGLEFPYGFASETWTHYDTALDLMHEIESRIEQRDFDVALIAAGGIGIPLTARVKRLGKVGIMLGGHLQVIFGVKGKRWKDRPKWRDVYFNEWWIDMPAEYLPQSQDNAGEYAYW
jgi:hypothetical protein